MGVYGRILEYVGKYSLYTRSEETARAAVLYRAVKTYVGDKSPPNRWTGNKCTVGQKVLNLV